MPKIIAIIPARSGSKGVVNKNIRLLGGRPLIEWSIAACRKSKFIDRVIVSTDSAEYRSLCEELGAEVPFLRPPDISTDFSTDAEFIKHALHWLSEHGYEPDYLVHIRPTTPFRSPEIIDLAIEQFMLADSKATALRSVHEMPESAYKSFEIANDNFLKMVGGNEVAIDTANNARQLFQNTYVANGYVDVLSVKFIYDSGLLHGDKVMPFITAPVVEVDTEEEFRLLEYLLPRQSQLFSKLFS